MLALRFSLMYGGAPFAGKARSHMLVGGHPSRTELASASLWERALPAKAAPRFV